MQHHFTTLSILENFVYNRAHFLRGTSSKIIFLEKN
ncbi:hypothetical protein NEOC65_001544 [Neochlamydia sp. AcF65]|nr:hypothetical protein [Neochlamydia sp. AcF65]